MNRKRRTKKNDAIKLERNHGKKNWLWTITVEMINKRIERYDVEQWIQKRKVQIIHPTMTKFQPTNEWPMDDDMST